MPTLRHACAATAAAMILAGCGADGPAPEAPVGGAAPAAPSAPARPGPATTGILETVLGRGELRCGVEPDAPGFAEESGGTVVGLDADVCRAVAAAVLGDPDAVAWVPLPAAERTAALASGEVDLLAGVVATATLDGAGGASPAATTFLDGLGVLVTFDDGIGGLEDLGGRTLCVAAGSEDELALETGLTLRGIPFARLPLGTEEELRAAFAGGACDAWAAPLSVLAAVRARWPQASGGPGTLEVLPGQLTVEPRGPVTRDGDATWGAVVAWVVHALVIAEADGVTQAGVDAFAASTDPAVAPAAGRLLGIADGFDPGLGLDPGFAVRAVRAVGNHGEMHRRHLGPDTGPGLPRGISAPWAAGGLLAPPPLR